MKLSSYSPVQSFLLLFGALLFAIGACSVIVTDVVIPGISTTTVTSSSVKLMTLCKDGSCYDVQTGEEIGNDPEVPLHLSHPVPRLASTGGK